MMDDDNEPRDGCYYTPGEIINELTDTYEGVKRADLDIFYAYTYATNERREEIVKDELASYEAWLRTELHRAKEYTPEKGY